MRYLLIIAVALVTVACGDDSPAGPTPITPQQGIVLPAHVCVSFPAPGQRIVEPCPAP